MYDLNQALMACGYAGPCENLSLLKWAIRAGASSHFFNELIDWLECQLSLVKATHHVRDNITRIFSMLRHSVLMKPSYGSDAAINPKEFRLQTLKVLIRQLQLRKLPERVQKLDRECSRRCCANVQDFSHMTITLNMRNGRRLIRCSTSSI